MCVCVCSCMFLSYCVCVCVCMCVCVYVCICVCVHVCVCVCVRVYVCVCMYAVCGWACLMFVYVFVVWVWCSLSACVCCVATHEKIICTILCVCMKVWMYLIVVIIAWFPCWMIIHLIVILWLQCIFKFNDTQIDTHNPAHTYRGISRDNILPIPNELISVKKLHYVNNSSIHGFICPHSVHPSVKCGVYWNGFGWAARGTYNTDFDCVYLCYLVSQWTDKTLNLRGNSLNIIILWCLFHY